jgi:hypothetical protein
LTKVANRGAAALEGSPIEGALFDLRIPVRLKRRGSELKLVLADRTQPVKLDRSLISNLARGFAWLEELRTGGSDSLGAIAKRENVTPRFIRRCCDLAFLPTDLIEEIVGGEQARGANSEAFKQLYPLPVRWDDQRSAQITSRPAGIISWQADA